MPAKAENGERMKNNENCKAIFILGEFSHYFGDIMQQVYILA